MTEISAHDAYHQLRRIAKASGLSTQQQFELYLHEAFLARLASSQFSDQFVLKGGLLVATLGIRRATRDADLLALGISNDEQLVKNIVKEIAQIELADGIIFDLNSIKSEIVREEHDYPSIRISMDATLAASNLKLKLDINFGDPIAPEQIEYTAMLSGEKFQLLAYPVEMVIAEKVETMMARGESNTRERDFADVYLLLKSSEIDGEALKKALVKTAQHRGRELKPLSEALGSLVDIRQQSWAAFRERSGLLDLPKNFSDITQEIVPRIEVILNLQDYG